MAWSLSELAALTGTEVIGDPKCLVSRLNALHAAGPGDLTFLSQIRRAGELGSTKASAVVVPSAFASQVSHGLISENPYLTYAQLSQVMDPDGLPFAGSIDALASIDPSAQLGGNVSIAPYAVIGAEVTIGEGSLIGPHAVLYPGTQVGRRCIIGAHSVIGSDGFGFAPSEHGWVKIHHLGCVRIGDDVEIGAGCTIDRGALDDTIIAAGVKLDNQIMIAHGCSIGARTAMAACVALAGSTHIGADVTVGGMTGFTGHLEVCDKVHIGAQALVSQSISKPGHYAGGAGGVMPVAQWRRNAVRFRQLDRLAARLARVEKANDSTN